MEITKQVATRVLEVVDAGLVSGLGVAEPGKMCIEAAVCFALGEPHSDKPSCVGNAVRAYKIRLNDAKWSSNEARTKGLRSLAIAQLGSDTLDQTAFAQRMALLTVREILPVILRQRGFNAEADACAAVKDLSEAHQVAKAAADAAYADAAAAYAAADAAADAADAAAAYAAADAAADAAAYADAAYADAAAAYAAATAAAAYAAAAADAAYADAAADKILLLAANLCVRVLTEMQSPGVEFLELING